MEIITRKEALRWWFNRRKCFDAAADLDRDIAAYVAVNMARHARELAEDRVGTTSCYNGVARINCADGYVDIRHTRSMPIDASSLNGTSYAGSVEDCRKHCRSRGISIYNYETA